MNEIIPLIKQILLNPFVIGTAIVVILFMNFCCFVANYSKKPKKASKKKAPAPAPAKKETSEEDASESSEIEE
jgi:predicted membrane protein